MVEKSWFDTGPAKKIYLPTRGWCRHPIQISALVVKSGQKSGSFFLFFLLFCIPRLGKVRDLQSGASNSAGKSLFAVSGILPRHLGLFFLPNYKNNHDGRSLSVSLSSVYLSASQAKGLGLAGRLAPVHGACRRRSHGEGGPLYTQGKKHAGGNSHRHHRRAWGRGLGNLAPQQRHQQPTSSYRGG